MTKTNTLSIKEFEYYLVFTDTNSNYIMAYGYTQKPAIMEMKYAIEALSQEQDLIAAIPNFHQVIDYVCFQVMKHKKFLKYMEEQEAKMAKAEAKAEKKKKKD